jgi:LytS/YehU family sensor histidine kinase
VKRLLPLIALLSALALGASIVRGFTQLQVLQAGFGSFLVGMLVMLEIGNWLGWTVWAVFLAYAVTGLQNRQPGLTTSLVLGAVLALAPMIVVPMLSSPWHWLVTGSPGVVHSTAHISGHNLATNLLLGIAMVAIAQGRSTAERTRRLERTASELRVQLAESQLAVLRARLDPHFLFNALNSAMVLARRGEGQKVERLIEHVSALLRHSLDAASAQIVPLRVELEVLQHYLAIEQVRFGDRLVVKWNVASGIDDKPVPSLVLQPLVENAIRHGFSDPSRALAITVTVEKGNGGLVLSVQDDGEGLTSVKQHPTEGIGLSHTRERLAGLYGDRAHLTLQAAEGGRGALVTVWIPDMASTT